MNELDQDIINLTQELHQLTIDAWLNNAFLTWQWWLLVGIFIGVWLIGIKFIERHRVFQIISYGFFVGIISLIFDVWGVVATHWYYPILLVPFTVRILPFDLGVIPVTYMLIYQRYQDWGSFLLAMTILALIFSFVFEPLAELIGIYKSLKWKHVYSFPIYIAIGVFCKFLFDKIANKTQKMY